MRMVDIITKKRLGKKLTSEEIRFFIKGYTSGEIPDYQAAALLMAITIQSMDAEETAVLTEAMAASGALLDLSEIPGKKADKHSSGGIGDKTSLICVPIAAACGVPVAKMSGRGLAHTGGTIDKLESIPGMRTNLTAAELICQTREIGLCITGQTGILAPADKKLYALRDVTGTVGSIPLIASSIMSKKIAAGCDCIVLDVKYGSGAFMETKEAAEELAALMVEIGRKTGRKTEAVLSPMDEPLGYAVGNALEVEEAIETLKGKGPEDLTALSLRLAALMVSMAKEIPEEKAMEQCREALYQGRALERFHAMILRQGGNPDVIAHPSLLGTAARQYEIQAMASGVIVRIDAWHIGTAACMLGAGRRVKEAAIHLQAGIRLHYKKNAYVSKGACLATLYTDLPPVHMQEMISLCNQAYEIRREESR